MYYRDRHCHIEFSSDSKEKFESYLRLVKGSIVTTKRLDYGPIHNGGRVKGTDMDYDKYVKIIAEHNEKSSQKILEGMEIGYATPNLNRIVRKVSNGNYDVQFLSAHQYDGKDSMNPKPEDYSQRKFLVRYYEKVVEAVKNFEGFDVLIRTDYALRLNRLDPENMGIVDEYLAEVSAELINDEKALELNMRGVYQHNNLNYYAFIVRRYIKVKGKLFSVNSGVHFKSYYRYHFSDTFKLLKNVNAEYLAVSENKKMTIIKLEGM